MRYCSKPVRRGSKVALLAIAAMVCVSAVEYKPKPWWKLEFEALELRAITVRDVKGDPVRCLYLIYRVTNASKRPIRYVPEFYLETDTDKTYLDLVQLEAERAVEEEKGRQYLNSVEMMGEIPPDLIKEGIAIFPDVTPQAKKLTLVVFGLTNEYRMLERFGSIIFERKAFVVEYARPGSSPDRELDPILYKNNEEWVWRR